MRPILVAVVLVVACTPAPIPPSPVRAGTVIYAPVDTVWRATMVVLTQHSVPVRVADRPSGVITADPMPLSVSDTLGHFLANCGKSAVHGRPIPTQAVWRVTVTPEARGTRVLVVIRYVRTGPPRTLIASPDATVAEQCASTGNWELATEEEIRQATLR